MRADAIKLPRALMVSMLLDLNYSLDIPLTLQLLLSPVASQVQHVGHCHDQRTEDQEQKSKTSIFVVSVILLKLYVLR